jgi:hypothetical protein
VDHVVKELHLDRLSEMLEKTVKTLDALSARTAALEQRDEKKIAERVLRTPRRTPFWASKAAETVLSPTDPTEVKAAAKSSIPSAVAGISDRIAGK